MKKALQKIITFWAVVLGVGYYYGFGPYRYYWVQMFIRDKLFIILLQVL